MYFYSWSRYRHFTYHPLLMIVYLSLVVHQIHAASRRDFSGIRINRGYTSTSSGYSSSANSIGGSYGSSSYSSGVDPYVSGSNTIDPASASAASVASAASPVSAVNTYGTNLLSNTYSSLVPAASSNSYSSIGSYGSGSSHGSSHGSIGSTYGSGGSGYGGNSASTSGNSYSVVYAGQGSGQGSGQGVGNKADTLSFLSSLAPSLLLSSLLLPLAISSLLAASNSTLFGRRKRDVEDDFDSSLYTKLDDIFNEADNEDDNDNETVSKINEVLASNDPYVVDTLNSLLHSYNNLNNIKENTEKIRQFTFDKGFSAIDNQCLEKLSCLDTSMPSSQLLDQKRAEILHKVLVLLKSDDEIPDSLKVRMTEASSKGHIDGHQCLTEYICKDLKQ